jgi:hypothetical protein
MKYFLVFFLAGLVYLEVAHQLSNGDDLNTLMCTSAHPDYHALGNSYREHLDNRR